MSRMFSKNKGALEQMKAQMDANPKAAASSQPAPSTMSRQSSAAPEAAAAAVAKVKKGSRMSAAGRSLMGY